MFRKISIKVAFFVNLVLFVVIGLGTIQLAKDQFNRLDDQYKAQAKFDSLVAAKAVGKLFEEAIDNGALSANEAFDTEYQPYGKFTVDNNGYLPTHNSKFQQPITGDKDKDKVGNRTKRIFNDPTGLAAAKNTQSGFIQVYKRDTGETMWDVSNPIIVKGKQWGNFRIGLSIDALQKAKMTLLAQLLFSMALILFLSFILVFYTIKKSLDPLTALTAAASRMADGEVNEQIYVVTSKDEIGDLAEVLERMRISLKTAMDRLMKR
jgi:methyl-accepting chemotaxis protein